MTPKQGPDELRKLDGTATRFPTWFQQRLHVKVRAMSSVHRTLVADLITRVGEYIVIRGLVFRLRVLAKTTFVVLKDCSGEAQCVSSTSALHDLKLKLDDAPEVRGSLGSDYGAKR